MDMTTRENVPFQERNAMVTDGFMCYSLVKKERERMMSIMKTSVARIN
jgi:hypothetical protein